MLRIDEETHTVTFTFVDKDIDAQLALLMYAGCAARANKLRDSGKCMEYLQKVGLLADDTAESPAA